MTFVVSFPFEYLSESKVDSVENQLIEISTNASFLSLESNFISIVTFLIPILFTTIYLNGEHSFSQDSHHITNNTIDYPSFEKLFINGYSYSSSFFFLPSLTMYHDEKITVNYQEKVLFYLESI